jgi:predicted GNAT superfamily acetyltransferase
MADEFATRVEQRRRAMDDGVDVLGWVFDPLDTSAANLYIARLGAVIERYLDDQDRVLAEWWIRKPHVHRRLSAVGKLTLRERDAAAAPVVRRPEGSGMTERGMANVALPGAPRRLWIEIPLHGEESWRAYVRDVFTTCFNRGYRVVDFVIDNVNGVGRYLMALKEDAEVIR